MNDELDEFGQAIPFAAAERLAAKLYGAVSMSIDNMTADIRLQDAKNDRAYREVAGQITFLPAEASAWVTRNLNLIIGSLIISLITFVLMRR